MSRVKRITRDIQDIQENHASQEGLYYFYDERDITVGYGLILCDDSHGPYSYGAHIIKFEFPEAYPNLPPLCTYINYTDIRISPNFHDNGKVCASRLNTWDEDKKNSSGRWVGTMDIYSVLKLIKMSILTENPMDNEPPYDYTSSKPKLARAYSNVVCYANMLALVNILTEKRDLLPDEINDQILVEINQHYTKYRENITEHLDIMERAYEGKVLKCGFYSNSVVQCFYSVLKHELESCRRI